MTISDAYGLDPGGIPLWVQLAVIVGLATVVALLVSVWEFCIDVLAELDLIIPFALVVLVLLVGGVLVYWNRGAWS